MTYLVVEDVDSRVVEVLVKAEPLVVWNLKREAADLVTGDLCQTEQRQRSYR